MVHDWEKTIPGSKGTPREEYVKIQEILWEALRQALEDNNSSLNH